LIASRQPSEVQEILERYEKDLKQTEAGYLDLIIKSGGLLTYDEIMGMPIDSLAMFVERLNSFRDDQQAAAAAARKPKGRM
jgi:hypothetical protein